MRAGLLRIVLAAGGVLGSAAQASADDPLERPSDPDARKFLEEGEALYKLAKWDDAIAEFEKGALRAPDLPVWYFALGQAHRQAGRYERARWYFERFLSSIDETDPEAADVVATTRELIDDMNAAQNRPPTDAAPAAADVPRARAERSRWTKSRKVSLVLGGVGLASLGAGVVFGVRANGMEDDAAVLCPMDSCARADEANTLLERGQRNALYANVAYGVGVAAVVGAAVLWVTGSPETNAPNSVVITPQASATFAGVDLAVRF
jgi:tetratricopeptide (TPR) repeat protein